MMKLYCFYVECASFYNSGIDLEIDPVVNIDGVEYFVYASTTNFTDAEYFRNTRNMKLFRYGVLNLSEDVCDKFVSNYSDSMLNWVPVTLSNHQTVKVLMTYYEQDALELEFKDVILSEFNILTYDECWDMYVMLDEKYRVALSELRFLEVVASLWASYPGEDEGMCEFNMMNIFIHIFKDTFK